MHSIGSLEYEGGLHHSHHRHPEIPYPISQPPTPLNQIYLNSINLKPLQTPITSMSKAQSSKLRAIRPTKTNHSFLNKPIRSQSSRNINSYIEAKTNQHVYIHRERERELHLAEKPYCVREWQRRLEFAWISVELQHFLTTTQQKAQKPFSALLNWGRANWVQLIRSPFFSFHFFFFF